MKDAVEITRQPGTVYEGTFLKSRQVPGNFGPQSIHTVVIAGSEQDFWGNSALNRSLEKVASGTRVRFSYTGRESMGEEKYRHLVDFKVLDGEGDVGISRFKLRLPEIDRPKAIPF